MNPENLFRELIKANYHKGGIKCLRLFRLEKDFFESLKDEVVQITTKEKPSNVREKTHISHDATKPSGNCFHFHLLNSSGRLDDPSEDYNRSVLEKKFHQANQFPNLAKFINEFPHSMNMKLLVLGGNSDLKPHESDIVLNQDKKSSIQVRFHLPIITNIRSEVLLDNDFFHFEAGSIFLFNHGCVHSALNHGDQDRCHLVWDMLLTKETFELMFSNKPSIPSFLERLIGVEKIVYPHRRQIIREFEIQGQGKELYDKLKLNRLGIKPYDFQNWFNKFLYLQTKVRGIDFAKIQ